MPTIPQYNQQIGVGGGDPTPRAQGEQFSSAIGRGISSFAQPLEQLQKADTIEQRLLEAQKEQDGKVWAGKTASDAQLQWDQHLKDRMAAATGSAPEFTPGILKDFDTYADDTLKSAPTPQAKTFLQQHLLALRTSLGQSAIQFQAHAAIGSRMTTQQQTIDTQAQLVAQDPSKYDQALNLIQTTMPEVGPEGTQKLHDYAVKALNEAAAGSAIQTDPSASYDLLNKSLHPFSTKEGKPVELPASGNPQFDTAVKQSGIPARLEPLARAIFAQESGSGTADTSGPNYAGARGPMQVTQDTFEGLRKGGYIPPDAMWDNPKDNTAAGLAYLKYLDTKFGGDPKKIAAAYYSGEKAIGPGGNIIDYHDPKNPAAPSTQQYVAQVTGRAQELVASASPDTVSAVATPGAVMAGATGSDTVPVKTGVPWVDNMPVASRLYYMQQASIAMQRGVGALQTDLKNKERDLQSMVLNGVAPPPTSVPTENDYVRAYGPAQGPAMYRDNVADIVQMGNGIRAMNAASPSERQAIIAAATPKPGPDYDHQLRLQGSLVKANDAIEKALKADPASYVMTNSPRVQTAAGNLSATLKNPQASDADKRQAFDTYATEMVAEQQRINPMQAPQLLTADQANKIAMQFNDQKTGGANAATLVRGLEQQYGNHWPMVFQQLAAKNKLPDAALVIPNMQDDGSRDRLATASILKESDLKAAIAPTDMKAIRDNLQTEFTSAIPTFTAQGANGNHTISVVLNSAERLAMLYRTQGKSVSAAAKQAFTETMGWKYKFGHTYRIPNSEQPDQVESGMQEALKHIDTQSVQVLTANGTPLTAAQLHDQTLDVLRTHSMWVTNGDESGVRLMVQGNNGTAYQVRDASGTPLNYTWDKLRALNTDSLARSSETQLTKALMTRSRADSEEIQQERALRQRRELYGW